MSAYAINAASGAVSEYTGHPFTSFADLFGRALAAGPGGLYLLGGDVDNLTGDPEDDTPIEANIRTGKTDFGTPLLTRLDSLQLHYVAAGRVALKVVSEQGGQSFERWYELPPQTAEAPRAGVVKPGRGPASSYWQFELVAVGKASVNAARAYPIALSRRR